MVASLTDVIFRGLMSQIWYELTMPSKTPVLKKYPGVKIVSKQKTYRLV